MQKVAVKHPVSGVGLARFSYSIHEVGFFVDEAFRDCRQPKRLLFKGPDVLA